MSFPWRRLNHTIQAPSCQSVALLMSPSKSGQGTLVKVKYQFNIHWLRSTKHPDFCKSWRWPIWAVPVEWQTCFHLDSVDVSLYFSLSRSQDLAMYVESFQRNPSYQSCRFVFQHIEYIDFWKRSPATMFGTTPANLDVQQIRLLFHKSHGKKPKGLVDLWWNPDSAEPREAWSCGGRLPARGGTQGVGSKKMVEDYYWWWWWLLLLLLRWRYWPPTFGSICFCLYPCTNRHSIWKTGGYIVGL